MYTEMNPSSLTNKELVEYAERYLHTNGLSAEWQREIVKRFSALINN